MLAYLLLACVAGAPLHRCTLVESESYHYATFDECEAVRTGIYWRRQFDVLPVTSYHCDKGFIAATPVTAIDNGVSGNEDSAKGQGVQRAAPHVGQGIRTR